MIADFKIHFKKNLNLAFPVMLSHLGQVTVHVADSMMVGRLGKEPQKAITSRLPTQTSQLILLLTDQELSEDARRLLDGVIGREYKLLFDHVSSTTDIVEVDG